MSDPTAPDMAKREGGAVSGKMQLKGGRLVRKAIHGASTAGSMLFSTIGELGSEDPDILQDQKKRDSAARKEERAAAKLLLPAAPEGGFTGSMGGTVLDKRWEEEGSMWLRAGAAAEGDAVRRERGDGKKRVERESPAAIRKGGDKSPAATKRKKSRGAEAAKATPAAFRVEGAEAEAAARRRSLKTDVPKVRWDK